MIKYSGRQDGYINKYMKKNRFYSGRHASHVGSGVQVLSPETHGVSFSRLTPNQTISTRLHDGSGRPDPPCSGPPILADPVMAALSQTQSAHPKQTLGR